MRAERGLACGNAEAGWLGRYAGRVQDPPPGGRGWQFQQRYGPEGDVFLTAYLADMLAAFVLCAAGVVLLDVKGSGPLAVGGCLLAMGILIGLLGLARAFQLGQAGRAWRAPSTRVPWRPAGS
jgi:hypothetical protein